MLKIDNLHARIGDTEILKGLSLELGAGEVHAIMGPNGSGKAPSPAFSPDVTTTKSPKAASRLMGSTCSSSMQQSAL